MTEETSQTVHESEEEVDNPNFQKFELDALPILDVLLKNGIEKRTTIQCLAIRLILVRLLPTFIYLCFSYIAYASQKHFMKLMNLI